MSKRPPPEPIIRKSIGLPAPMWEEIDAVARTIPGKLPSEPATVKLLVRRALDLFARPRWQPIETVPRDTSVLFSDGQRVRQGEWWPAHGCWSVDFQPTHWRPLPEPPDAG